MALIIVPSDGKEKKVNIRRSIFFGSYDTYRDIRKNYYDDAAMKGKRYCYKCGHKFVPADIIYLSITDDEKRILTCEKCSLDHINRG